MKLELREYVSYLPQEFGFYPGLTVFQNLDYMGVLAELKDKEDRRQRINELLERMNLVNHQSKKAKALSGGMKRRLGICTALIKNPKILIVDEPTAGLDPIERMKIRELLLELSIDRTVLLSTHIVEDISQTCKKIGILKEGILLYDDSLKKAYEMTGEADLEKVYIKVMEKNCEPVISY